MKTTKLFIFLLLVSNLSTYSQNQPPSTGDIIGTYYYERSCGGIAPDKINVPKGYTDCLILDILPNQKIIYSEFNNSRGKKNQKTLKWELTTKDDRSVIIISGEGISRLAYSPHGYFTFELEKKSGNFCLISTEDNGLGSKGDKWIRK